MAHLRKLAPAFSLSLLTLALSGCLSSSSDSDEPTRISPLGGCLENKFID